MLAVLAHAHVMHPGRATCHSYWSAANGRSDATAACCCAIVAGGPPWLVLCAAGSTPCTTWSRRGTAGVPVWCVGVWASALSDPQSRVTSADSAQLALMSERGRQTHNHLSRHSRTQQSQGYEVHQGCPPSWWWSPRKPTPATTAGLKASRCCYTQHPKGPPLLLVGCVCINVPTKCVKHRAWSIHPCASRAPTSHQVYKAWMRRDMSVRCKPGTGNGWPLVLQQDALLVQWA